MRIALLVLGLLTLGPANPNASFADITTDLQAYWPFTGNAQDASGNGNHGTIMGNVIATVDRLGNQSSAYRFDGVSSRIDVPHSASLAAPTTTATFAAWIKRDGWGTVGSLYSPILTKSISTPNAFQYRWITSQTGLSLAFNSWNESAGLAYTFEDTTWYHVASTWEADSLRSYINGVLRETTYFPVTINSDTRTLSIGSDIPGVLEIFKGTIDELRIYSRALSDADIAELAGVTVSVPHARVNAGGVLLGNAYPNPLRPSTVIPFSLSAPQSVSLDIIDIAGRRVCSLLDGHDMPAGLHSIPWDGTDVGGHPVRSGVYMYRLTTPSGEQAHKLFVQR